MKSWAILSVAMLMGVGLGIAIPWGGSGRLAATSVVPESEPASAPASAPKAPQLLYTTYFYTAHEAIIYGYEKETNVRIIDPARAGTIWQGVVGKGESKTVPTGAGVFTFVSDKKASILVGTPTSCSAVGFYVQDEKGNFTSNHFYSHLPTASTDDCRMIVWANEDVNASVANVTDDKQIWKGSIKKGEHFEITGKDLPNGKVLQIDADKKAIQVEIYYDEGFIVPATNGRGSGNLFRTYLGKTTEGKNDLVLINYFDTSKVKVEDIKSGETIWEGTIDKQKAHTITLSQRYVKVTSDNDISVEVCPYEHYKGAYAEHHFSMGAEGTGIESEFITSTPLDLWIFSYYDGNMVKITNLDTGADVWTGILKQGEGVGKKPGQGLYRITSDKGISVMGGSSACGGAFSPAGKMFAVDEALFAVVEQIKAERVEAAKAEGRTASEAEINAPLQAKDYQKMQAEVSKSTGRKNISVDEVKARANDMNGANLGTTTQPK